MSLFIGLFTFLVALTIHEFAHGWVALKRGDPTATVLGRLTLNPLAHIDPIGTIILPLTLIMISSLTHTQLIIFGWAKPVPINFLKLRNPKKDMVLVGLAGPLANILLAFVLGIVANLFKATNPLFFSVLKLNILVNLFLAIFNLIPVPPLDGSRVIMGLLPRKLSIQYSLIEPFGFLIIIGLLYLGLIDLFILPTVKILLNFILGS